MFIGKYYHHLEKNQRISLPKKFRELAQSWVVTRGLDGCLFLFKPETFQANIENIANRSLTKKANRDLVRLMTNEATELNSDANGRVHLPEYLITFAQLTKDVVIVGSLNRIEIWDQEKYHQYIAQLENQAEAIAESVDVQS
jgi:MraZ protein